jgi:hypothetical protein
MIDSPVTVELVRLVLKAHIASPMGYLVVDGADEVAVWAAWYLMHTRMGSRLMN